MLYTLLGLGKSDVGSYDIGRDTVVHIWEEEEWDGLVPIVYFRVERDGQELIPRMMLSPAGSPPYRFEVAFSADGNLACVYEADRAKTEAGWVIVYDSQTERCCTNWQQHASDLAARDEWFFRFQLIRDANPELSDVLFFD